LGWPGNCFGSSLVRGITGLAASLIAVFTVGYYAESAVAFAQYMGNVGDSGQTGTYTLEEALELQTRRITAAEANPASGSGTPYLDAGGVVGAAVIAGAVFGSGPAGGDEYRMLYPLIGLWVQGRCSRK
jgi:hypothetical protein